MHKVYLGLGTNLGDRSQHLKDALEAIENQLGTIQRKSSVHETKAWGKTDQPDFLNMVIMVQTEIWPLKLMEKILQIEEQLGRVRKEKWGSRLIDIDVLYFNDWYFNTPGLIVPHPFIQQREFVLQPLQEISEH
ncbi:2-amino-4-hydroxy-6-hydroxymethyldihydropteridine diphosphokinase [Marinilongibacter aquaticus]|uniref:2-amino-4-hydroxy-6- hydroxymethyldihydropteridine diphosphokinase n=1 Tax=Marinilongibacter aquaticus TaxID=2975157 RepID=UPI0021BD6D9C|nr:2-amino-4-hydroxy-6-hydroxymethyldihydropteridine diphosphokinase [Marinilongibacter aquaticus]UBM59782.1 2-amino-4-hydroxy-6-hydroxymethyldihydropteridine diphosphokinase [Marinilongibacter aquaticus]